MNERLFISDLHLDPSRPRATAAFLQFLATEARQAGHLYILGDLFEFWIGDDDDAGQAHQIQQALAAYTAAGHGLSVMRGNRDFLLGAAFARRTGARLLPDPTAETLSGERVLIMHGDLLCTDDQAYQRYRRIVNNRLLQPLFLALPRSWRRAAGDEGRRRSRDYGTRQLPAVMDVNAGTVADAMRRQDARILIHGHTHRPGIHRFEIDGRDCVRIVLGDWYEQGSVLRWSDSGYELSSLPFG